jgi:hypothetical protein
MGTFLLGEIDSGRDYICSAISGAAHSVRPIWVTTKTGCSERLAE